MFLSVAHQIKVKLYFVAVYMFNYQENKWYMCQYIQWIFDIYRNVSYIFPIISIYMLNYYSENNLRVKSNYISSAIQSFGINS